MDEGMDEERRGLGEGRMRKRCTCVCVDVEVSMCVNASKAWHELSNAGSSTAPTRFDLAATKPAGACSLPCVDPSSAAVYLRTILWLQSKPILRPESASNACLPTFGAALVHPGPQH